MQLNKTTLTKALLALNFVSASLAAGLPGACNDKAAPSSQLLQQIAAQTDSTPEMKTYSFLRLADAYLSNPDEATVERLYSESGKSVRQGWDWRKTHTLEWWIRQVLTDAYMKPHSAAN